ncbi:MAG TPA: 3-phosphoshikimate 1-carboxyvinyltransferase [Thermoplasmata archaeon]|nr:3-phosphoshikimate 1-carboxyvinyltransferase [Thermoplasmata archaeon]HTW56394.1 3-phosphoshikimate 1-carboxyvinyltransferase [Thermoplasmata archaeon]
MTVRLVRAGVARGRIRAPPSKSYTHRALVAGHLARRRFSVRRPLVADDTRATAAGLAALGSRVVVAPDRWVISPSEGRSDAPARIDCGESGTTLRFLAAAAALSTRPTVLVGRGRLAERPMRPLLDALGRLGARCAPASASRALPLRIEGPLRGGAIALEASESSQFLSALLLTLPTAADDSTIRLVGPIVSAPYVRATRAVLGQLGVRLAGTERRIRVPGGQRYRGGSFEVPGDASSAAYLWAAAAVSRGRVRVVGLDRTWPQADLAVLRILARAGCRVELHPDGATVEGRPLAPFAVDLTDAPDLYPLAGVLAALAPGTSRLAGAAHVVHKESDRRSGTARLVRALGARAEVRANALRIEGTPRPRALELPSETDHRMVMSAAIGALAGPGGSRIGDAGAVAKSFPGFWDALAAVVPEAVAV